MPKNHLSLYEWSACLLGSTQSNHNNLSLSGKVHPEFGASSHGSLLTSTLHEMFALKQKIYQWIASGKAKTISSIALGGSVQVADSISNKTVLVVVFNKDLKLILMIRKKISYLFLNWWSSIFGKINKIGGLTCSYRLKSEICLTLRKNF